MEWLQFAALSCVQLHAAVFPVSTSLVPQQMGWPEAPHGVKPTHRHILATWLVVIPSASRFCFMARVGARFPSEKWVPHRGTSSLFLCSFLCDKMETISTLSQNSSPSLVPHGQRVMNPRAAQLFHPPGVEGCIINPSL